MPPINNRETSESVSKSHNYNRENTKDHGFDRGPDGNCLCPNCGHKEHNQLVVPCYNRKCPKCGTPMTSG
jgi:hypothetical protein